MLITKNIWDELISFIGNVLGHKDDMDSEKVPDEVIKSYLENMEEKESVENLFMAIMDILQFSKSPKKPNNDTFPKTTVQNQFCTVHVGDVHHAAETGQEELRKEISELTKKLHECEKKHLQLEIEYNRAMCDNGELSKEITELKSKVVSLDNTIKGLNEMKTKFNETKIKLNQVEKESVQLKIEVKGYLTNLGTVTLENKALQNKLCAAKDKMEELDKNVENLRTKINVKVAENGDLKSALERTVQNIIKNLKKKMSPGGEDGSVTEREQGSLNTDRKLVPESDDICDKVSNPESQNADKALSQGSVDSSTNLSIKGGLQPTILE